MERLKKTVAFDYLLWLAFFLFHPYWVSEEPEEGIKLTESYSYNMFCEETPALSEEKEPETRKCAQPLEKLFEFS